MVWSSKAVVVANMRGNSTKDCNDMRNRLNLAGGGMKFVKNSLAAVALQDMPARGLLERLLRGQVCLIYADPAREDGDPMAVLKAAQKLEEEFDGMAILGGAFEDTLLTRAGLLKAADLPPLDTVRANLVGSLKGPAYNLTEALNAPKMRTARALTAALNAPALDMANIAERHAQKLGEEAAL